MVKLVVWWLIIFFLGFFRSLLFGQVLSGNHADSSKLKQILLDENDRCNREVKTRNECYRRTAKKVLDGYEFTRVLAAMAGIQEESPEISLHDQLHFISTEQYLREKDLPAVFNQCTEVFFNACYHGVVIGHLLSDKLQNVLSSCNALKDRRVEGYYHQCVHGIGHALMIVSENELIQSLAKCDLVGDRDRDSKSCYEGVFMENFPASTSSDHPSKYLKDDDLLYPCNALDKKYQEVCYAFLPTHFRVLADFDLNKTIKMCDLVPAEYQPVCFRSVASGSIIAARSDDFEGNLKTCAAVPAGIPRESCVKGIVIAYADRFGGRQEMMSMFDFCTKVEKSYQPACYRQIGESLRSWVANEAEQSQLCKSRVAPEFVKLCTK